MKSIVFVLLVLFCTSMLSAEESAWVEYEQYKVSSPAISPITRIKVSSDGSEIWTLSTDTWIRIFDYDRAELLDSIKLPTANADFDIESRRFIMWEEVEDIPARDIQIVKVYCMELDSKDTVFQFDEKFDPKQTSNLYVKSGHIAYFECFYTDDGSKFQMLSHYTAWHPAAPGENYGSPKLFDASTGEFIIETYGTNKPSGWDQTRSGDISVFSIFSWTSLQNGKYYSENLKNKITYLDSSLNFPINKLHGKLRISNDKKTFVGMCKGRKSNYDSLYFFRTNPVELISGHDIGEFHIYTAIDICYDITDTYLAVLYDYGHDDKMIIFDIETMNVVDTILFEKSNFDGKLKLTNNNSFIIGSSDGHFRIIQPDILNNKNLFCRFSASSELVLTIDTISFYGYASQECDYHWDFGDGETSSERNPRHQYIEPGFYTVKLSVKNESGENTHTKTDYIEVREPLVASFSNSIVELGTHQTISFYDQSTGNIDSYHWEFGDGDTSDESNPEHTFKRIGDYTVVLTIRDDYFSETMKKNIEIREHSYLADNILLEYIQPNYLTFNNILSFETIDHDTYSVVNQNNSQSIFFKFNSQNIIEDTLSHINKMHISQDSLGHVLLLAYDKHYSESNGMAFKKMEMYKLTGNTFKLHKTNKFADIRANDIWATTVFDSLSMISFDALYYIWNSELEIVNTINNYYIGGTANSNHLLLWTDDRQLHRFDSQLTDESIEIDSTINFVALNDKIIALFSPNRLIILDNSSKMNFLNSYKMDKDYNFATFIHAEYLACVGTDANNGFDVIDLEGNIYKSIRFPNRKGTFQHITWTPDGNLLLSGFLRQGLDDYPWVVKYDPSGLITGVAEDAPEKTMAFSISPNPVEGILFLNYKDTENTRIEIFDLLGNRVATIPSGAKLYDTSKLDRGVYFVIIYCRGETISKKMVKF
jgi:PKD repeat protein